MGHTFVVVLVLVVAMTTGAMAACSTPLSTKQFRRLFCNSCAVFRGTMGRAMSSAYKDENGGRVEASSFFFNVAESFRGNDLQGTEAKVSHVWQERNATCPSGAFPDMGQETDFLVFVKEDATTGALQVNTCRHSFPWSCVPDDFKRMLPFIRCRPSRRG